ncbi:MAG: hypothetical protein ACI8PZ_001958, partial [Myxococcota bacterium]
MRHGLRTIASITAALYAVALPHSAVAGDDDLPPQFMSLSVTGDGVTPGSSQLLASLAVDARLADHGVSAGASGELSYGIGLELPPALLSPELSLTYSSGAGPQSWVGRGWSLSAGMRITSLGPREQLGAYSDTPDAVRVSGGGLSGLLIPDGLG